MNIKDSIQTLLDALAQGDINLPIANSICEECESLSFKERKNICNRFEEEIGESLVKDIWLFSYMLSIAPEEDLIKRFCLLVIENKDLKWQHKYFLFNQLSCKVFLDNELNTEDVGVLLWELLQQIKYMLIEQMSVKLSSIPVEERNSEMAVVIVEQFLTQEHGPTKTALDRCYVLQKVMNKKVLLINTAELTSGVGAVPFYRAMRGNYNPNYLNRKYAYWKGEKIPFLQCEDKMPCIEIMEDMLKVIMEYKPGAVVLVGGASLFGGLVNEIVPVVTVGTIQSGLATTLSEYQIIDNIMIDKCTRLARRLGKREDYIIPGRFTFSLKAQVQHISRVDVDIPENSFVMAFVGGRLDYEITDEFLEHMENIMKDDMYLMAIGKWDNWQQSVDKHPKIREKVKYLGFCDDILSRLELCDIYVNPIRRGGGTSCVEAMYKKKPVVTVDYGDVAGIVGSQFACRNYQDMEEVILRYRDDREFYISQSEKAAKLAEDYLDSEKEFTRIMKEYAGRISKM